MIESAKLRRIRRWVAIGSGTAATVALLVAAIVVTSRPRWRTYTFPADPKTGMVVVIDYPDSWQIKDRNSITKFGPSMRLDLNPIPPIGIARWMQEKLLRQDIHYDGTDQITIDIASGSSYQSMATVEKQAASVRQPGITYTVSRRHYALGPALFADVSIDIGRLSGRGTGNMMQIHGMIIYPDAASNPNKMSISVVGIAAKSRFARFGAAVDQMIPRIRLVRVAGSTR